MGDDGKSMADQLKDLADKKGIRLLTVQEAKEEFGTKVTPGATVSMKEEFGKVTSILQKYGVTTTYPNGTEKSLEVVLKEYGKAVLNQQEAEFKRVQEFNDTVKNIAEKYGIPIEAFNECKNNDDITKVLLNSEKTETTEVIGAGFGVNTGAVIQDGFSSRGM